MGKDDDDDEIFAGTEFRVYSDDDEIFTVRATRDVAAVDLADWLRDHEDARWVKLSIPADATIQRDEVAELAETNDVRIRVYVEGHVVGEFGRETEESS